ncbi:flagellar basal body rod protein FlgB [Gottschalkia purinilytica]|uniref:Flagellar basal body rod protein FlgB n=1 Tax=Gottschalkia purinilytica TaxID=1503 RepID=A0A0L0WBJ2_GOTPU|nr:flagellar basal body rod protein FlgB [Gottschalkia purinilytica]KNF08807.1 flagellar basal body rod protein FlgB [Gottschalkia purinilytica]
MLSKIYGQTNILKAALDGSSAKDKAIANNMSNVNTPGYKRLDVDFEGQLKKILTTEGKLQLQKTHQGHIGDNNSIENFNPNTQQYKNISVKRDKNGVNMDVEMAEMAKNTIMYNALITQISRKFNSIKTVISEGGK